MSGENPVSDLDALPQQNQGEQVRLSKEAWEGKWVKAMTIANFRKMVDPKEESIKFPKKKVDWIYIVMKDGTIRFYNIAHITRQTPGVYGHTSLLDEKENELSKKKDGGDLVVYAGTFTTEKGQVIAWDNNSGHFIPPWKLGEAMAKILGLDYSIFTPYGSDAAHLEYGIKLFSQYDDEDDDYYYDYDNALSIDYGETYNSLLFHDVYGEIDYNNHDKLVYDAELMMGSLLIIFLIFSMLCCIGGIVGFYIAKIVKGSKVDVDVVANSNV